MKKSLTTAAIFLLPYWSFAADLDTERSVLVETIQKAYEAKDLVIFRGDDVTILESYFADCGSSAEAEKQRASALARQAHAKDKDALARVEVTVTIAHFAMSADGSSAEVTAEIMEMRTYSRLDEQGEPRVSATANMHKLALAKRGDRWLIVKTPSRSLGTIRRTWSKRYQHP